MICCAGCFAVTKLDPTNGKVVKEWPLQTASSYDNAISYDVVDVTSLMEDTWFDHAGNFHSDALHVVERYTPHPTIAGGLRRSTHINDANSAGVFVGNQNVLR